jgi:hypothetical protein
MILRYGRELPESEGNGAKSRELKALQDDKTTGQGDMGEGRLEKGKRAGKG